MNIGITLKTGLILTLIFAMGKEDESTYKGVAEQFY